MYTIVPYLLFAYLRKPSIRTCKSPLEIILLIIFIYEIIQPYFIENSYIALYSGLFIPAAILVYYFVNYIITSNNIKVIYYLFSVILLLASISVIFAFIFFTAIVESGGWGIDEIIPLRYLFAPMGVLVNDWGLIFLFLFPFPLLLLNKLPLKFRIIPIIIFLIGIYASILTFSRGTYISVLILFTSIFILSLIFKIRIKFDNKKHIALIFVLFILALIPIREPLMKMLPINPSTSQQLSVEGRFDQWRRCVEIHKGNPICGIGANGFKRINKIISNKNQVSYTNKVTNSYLQILVEKGVIGFILYLSLFIYIGYLAVNKLIKGNKRDVSLDTIVVFSLFIAVAVKEFAFSSLFDNQFTFLTFSIWLVVIKVNMDQNIKLKFHDLVISVLLIIVYSISFYYYYEIKNSIDLNERSVQLSFENRTKQTEMSLSMINQTKIKSPIVYSNLALSTVTKVDTFCYNTFANGDDLIRYQDTMKMETMIDLTQKAVDIAPYEPQFLLNLGWLHIVNEEQNKALDIFYKILKYNPNNVSALLSIGLFFENSNNLKTALIFYSKAVSSSPFILESPFFSEFQQRHPSLITTVIENAVEIINSQTQTIANQSKLAKLYLCQNMIEQSKSISINIIESLPNLNRAWLTLGDVYFQEKDFDQAKICYQKAHMLDSRDKLVVARLCKLFFTIKDNAQHAYYKQLILKMKSHSTMTVYFKKNYLYSHIQQETFPYNRREYFSPSIISMIN
jgi:tetratricopeptide (TPR) repeat protein/O-antigen ligase